MPVSYPLDLTGISPANLITNELHSVSESQYKDYYFIVPNFSPFFIDSFVITSTIGGVVTVLQENIHFSFVLEYVTGTRKTGKVMYGGVTIHDPSVTGILSVTYRTIGGDQIADRMLVLTTLADKAYNPRTTIWDILTNIPNSFPPLPHYQDYNAFFGQEEVVIKLGLIRDAILANATLNQNQLSIFIDNLNTGLFNKYLVKTGGTMTGDLILNPNPTNPYAAVTKQYVDNLIVNSGDIGLLRQLVDELSVKIDNSRITTALG